ncbi:MAG: hypothetical protein HDR80_00925 [Bacteroides sp.]|nr:hypothetical protein [Bacteroides sp.]
METNLETLCRAKEQALLAEYFPKSPGYADAETIGEFTPDLPHRIEAEFEEYLKGLWKEYSDTPLVLEEQKLRRLMTETDRQAIETAYRDAKRITLLERITHSNHEDVNRYKGLLEEYTKRLLSIMRIDFLEEITGNHINCKAFEE